MNRLYLFIAICAGFLISCNPLAGYDAGYQNAKDRDCKEITMYKGFAVKLKNRHPNRESIQLFTEPQIDILNTLIDNLNCNEDKKI